MTLRHRIKNGDLVKIGFLREDDRSGGGYIFCGKIDKKARAYISEKSTEERKRLKAEYKRYSQMAKTTGKEIYIEDAEYYKAKLDAWVPYLDREIIQDYPSLLNSEISIILCEGDEHGKFWLISEFYRTQCGNANYKQFKVTKRQQDIYCKKYDMPCLEAIATGKCEDGGKDEVREDEQI